MGLLDELRQSDEAVKNRKPCWCIYSDVGDGKTSLAAEFPNSAMVIGPGEQGVLDLKATGKIPEDFPVYQVETFAQLIDVTKELIATAVDNGIVRVSFDSLTDFCRMLEEEIIEQYCEGSRASYTAFNKGIAIAADRWNEWILLWTKMQEAGISPIFLAHSKVVDVLDPHAGAYTQHTIDLPEVKTVSLLRPVLQRVTELGFIHRMSEKSKEEKGKVRGGIIRTLHFTGCAAYEAKSRVGMASVPMGANPTEAYKNLTASYGRAFNTKKESK